MASTGNWPRPLAYDQALLNRATTFTDREIKQGKLVEDASGPIRFNGGGKYVCVYRVSDWVVRCFAENAPADVSERYRAITAFVSKHSTTLPFLVEHTWIERGIHVEGRVVPFLKVPFVQSSQTLGAFLANHYTETYLVRDIAEKFLAMINQLEKEQVAHGDLDITNILVIGSGSSLFLKLIDYDGMYVPALASHNLKTTELGHIHFQHPDTTTIRHFGPHMDRFSALVIYLSLVALSVEPSLWDNCAANDTDQLLLSSADYANLSNSANYNLLIRCQNKATAIQTCLHELQASINDRRMPDSLQRVLRSTPQKVVRETPFGAIPQIVSQSPADPLTVDTPAVDPPKADPLPRARREPRPNRVAQVLYFIGALLFFVALACMIFAVSSRGALIASWILAFVSWGSNIISLSSAPRRARGWKIFYVVMGSILLIINGILQFLL